MLARLTIRLEKVAPLLFVVGRADGSKASYRGRLLAHADGHRGLGFVLAGSSLRPITVFYVVLLSLRLMELWRSSAGSRDPLAQLDGRGTSESW